MSHPRNSGEWNAAIASELKAKRISDAQALTAFRLATVINWSPKEPGRQGRPALYWRNKDAVASLGIGWRTFERHRSALRQAGLIDMDENGNLVPLLPTDNLVGTPTVSSDGAPTVNVDGPFKVDTQGRPSRSTYEVDRGTVNLDGAGADTWSRQSSLEGSTPEASLEESRAPHGAGAVLRVLGKEARPRPPFLP